MCSTPSRSIVHIDQKHDDVNLNGTAESNRMGECCTVRKTYYSTSLLSGGPGAVVKTAYLNRGFEPQALASQVSKKQNVSSPLTRKKSILWGGSVAEG